MSKTILILSANPKDTSRLRLDQEVREIDDGLQRASRRDEFVLKQKWATRPIDVRRAMLDFNPNIVHFCGHGSGEEGIAFEDETGHRKLVTGETLGTFFELFSQHVECVLLNACYSEIQAEFIAKHIDYVIGMSKGIDDIAAIEFAIAFYDAIGAGKSIEFAYNLARNAIQWANIPEHLTPVLKKRFPDFNGIWKATLVHGRGIIAEHALKLEQNGDKLLGLLVNTSLNKDKVTTIEEIFDGYVHGREITLTGKSYTTLNGDPMTYNLDVFKLTMSSDGKHLTGICVDTNGSNNIDFFMAPNSTEHDR